MSGLPGAADWANWTPIRAGIVRAERTEAGARVLLQPFEGRGGRVLAELPGALELHGLAASPDGRTIVVSRLDRDESNVVLARRR